MEVNAVIEMFKRSVEKHDVKIDNYVGEGDSKTYGNLIKAKPYGDDLIVAKKECVGHVRKRMGTRLRDLVKSHVGEVPIKTGKNAGKKRRVKTPPPSIILVDTTVRLLEITVTQFKR